MKKNTNTVIRLCACLVLGLLVLSGCASQQKKKTAPEQKPAVTAEKPMMMDDSRTHKVLYVPTGERSSSAVAIDKRGPAEVNLGSPFEYVITCENLTAGHRQRRRGRG